MDAFKLNKPFNIDIIAKRQKFTAQLLEKKYIKSNPDISKININAIINFPYSKKAIYKDIIPEIISEIEQIINFESQNSLKVRPLPDLAINHYYNMFLRFQALFS